jgi:RHS repeat-associated protein
LDFNLYYNAQIPAETIPSAQQVLGANWLHSYQQYLSFTGSPPTQVTWFAEGGQQFSFVPSGTGWAIQSQTRFIQANLTYSAPNWLITFPKTNSVLTFNSAGVLQSIADGYGNALTLRYTSGVVTTITEPQGRALVLGYNATYTLLTSITDPKSYVYTLGYDPTNTVLTSVTSPAGCAMTYGYNTPSNGLINTSSDGNHHEWQYQYNSSNQLTQVTSPESSIIKYTYGTISEQLGETGSPTSMTCNQTILTDARNNAWTYIFDLSNNLWRVVDPSGYDTHYYWDGLQDLLYVTGPYSPMGSDRDNTNNRFARAAYDVNGNLLQAFATDGMVTQYTYDSDNHLVSVYPGRAHMGVQGLWSTQFGSQGYVLCGFNLQTGDDVFNLPSYISSSGFSYSPTSILTNNPDTSPTVDVFIDPRTPLQFDVPIRAQGYWRTTSSFTITIPIPTSHAPVQYNLSLYACSSDNAAVTATPLSYNEQTGRDTIITVTDAVQTQTFEIFNDSPGAWVTFPVQSNSSTPVVVTVQPQTGCANAQISAIAFDPYDNHMTTFTYNSAGDVLTMVDPLGYTSTWAYNSNGTLKTFTDARTHTTSYYYTDTYLNLTQIVDANSQSWNLTYDHNSNLQTLEDPNLHTWSFTYDDQNRLETASDPYSDTVTWVYDAAGNVMQYIDANTVSTYFYYTPSNRLSEILDAVGGTTLFGYDNSGNLLSFQTPNDALANRQSTFVWDMSERLTQTTLADGTTQIGAAYDALNQLRAVTPPNGMQSTLASINVAGAQNWASNPGMEDADPYTPTLARRWAEGPVGPTYTRDTTFAHTGEASIKIVEPGFGAGYWSQSPLFVRSGEKLLLSGYAATNSPTTGNSYGFSIITRQFSGSTSEISTGFLPGPIESGGSPSWQAIAPISFQVNGDGQYTRFPVEELRLYYANGGGSGALDGWFDDMQLNSLSASVNYDQAGRPLQSTTPDGAQRQMVYDRFGRLVLLYDPNGHTVAITYDGKNQVLTITDSLGYGTTFVWDPVGNLHSVQDAKGNTTTYTYENMNRLQTVTYPDTTTEGFTYDNAGNLYTYTNNRSQSRTFAYDNANRLTSVTYNTDSTTIVYTYDHAFHVLTRKDRNGDLTTFIYDNLYRVVEVERTPGTSSPTLGWTQIVGYDHDSNRTSFSSSASGLTSQSWTVPTNGYDALDRLTTWKDRATNAVAMTYDVDSNRTSLTFPYGSPAPKTSATFDVVDRLLSLGTTNLGTNILPITTAYDAASQRIMSQVGGDHVDYVLDADGQLIQENTNRFVERDYNGFQNGTLAGTQTSVTTNNVTLATLSDSFTASSGLPSLLNMDRWRMAVMSGRYVGMSILPQNNMLTFAAPLWGSDLIQPYFPPVYEAVSYYSSAVYGAVEHRVQLTAPFDIQVNFLNYQGEPHDTNVANAVLGMMVADTPFEQANPTPTNAAIIARDAHPSYNGTIYSGGTSVATSRSGSTSDTSGMFRITSTLNSGGTSTTVTVYYWNNSTSAWVALTSYATFTTNALWVSLFFQPWAVSAAAAFGTGAFQDFQVNGTTPNTAASGTYTSRVYDASSSVYWNSLTWMATVPTGATLKFQVAASNTATGPFTFIGPDGTSGTYFTTSGTALPSVFTTTEYRYFQYQATFLPGSGGSPTLSRVDVAYEGTNPSNAILYTYDGVGNILSKTTDAAAVTSTDVRTPNTLNQIATQVITPAGLSATTWSYTYDASGNMLTRTNTSSSAVITYAWDEDNRLLSVTPSNPSPAIFGPTTGAGIYNTSTFGATSASDISYTYDALGRMMTRTDQAGTTQFVWDGMDLVMELAPNGTQTRYYVVLGELVMFERTSPGGSSITYQVLADALGSVRRVLDQYNNVVAQFDYDAWGNLLPSSWDNVPGGFMYRYVGIAGVRYDAGTELYYMRQRSYDPTTQRFVSRDKIRNSNRYTYVYNNPNLFVDPFGLAPRPPTGPNQGGTGTFAHAHIADKMITGLEAKGWEYSQGARKGPNKPGVDIPSPINLQGPSIVVEIKTTGPSGSPGKVEAQNKQPSWMHDIVLSMRYDPNCPHEFDYQGAVDMVDTFYRTQKLVAPVRPRTPFDFGTFAFVIGIFVSLTHVASADTGQRTAVAGNEAMNWIGGGLITAGILADAPWLAGPMAIYGIGAGGYELFQFSYPYIQSWGAPEGNNGYSSPGGFDPTGGGVLGGMGL